MANELDESAPPGVRDVNTWTLLDLLRRDGDTTRTELLARSGLSKATVSGIIADLVERGVVHEVGKEQQGRGRSRVLLRFNPTARTVIGANIDDAQCTLVAADLDGSPQSRTSRELRSVDPAEVVDAIADAVGDLRELAESPIVGLGVGAPGQVDRSGRRIDMAVSHDWRDVALADLLEQRTGLSVTMANRAKVAALGQAGADGQNRPHDLIYVFLGSGVVAGIVIDGQLCQGRDGAAGDVGHLTIDPDGALCGCGNRGCLHTVAAEPAILAQARSRARSAGGESLLHTRTGGRLDALTLSTLATAADDGDDVALAVVADVGDQLGIVIANLVNTLNPEMVVLGGPGAQLGEPLLNTIRREVRQRALTVSATDLAIVSSTAGEEAGATGAAMLWLKRALDGPVPLSALGLTP